MTGVVFKPIDPEAERALAPTFGSTKKGSSPEESEDSRRRRRHKRPPSLWKRFRKGLGEQRRRIAVVVALFVTLAGAMLIYMLIRPE